MFKPQHFANLINEARADKRRLRICGNGSKRQHLPVHDGEMLAVNEYRGIEHYDPAELVITVRAGTPIREVVAELAQRNQCLAFEPPLFFNDGTVGGMVAAGFSGPARPWHGSVRDAVLGVEMVNGLGEVLSFGGQVMKNVAGYDVSRLMAGAFGALGVLLSVSLRVQPLQEHELTLAFDESSAQANTRARQWAQKYLPLSATWWQGDRFFVRLSGTEAAVLETAQLLGGEQIDGSRMWVDVRDQNLDFFKPSTPEFSRASGQQLWRLVLPPATPVSDIGDDPQTGLAIEWGGGQRWLWHESAELVQAYAQQHGGWSWAVGEPMLLDPGHSKYMRAIKQAFDPDDLFVSMLPLSAAHAN
jgi:glycolate dehydrogenase FAD-binding subunit